MQSRDFCFWLQGFFELVPRDIPISFAQAETIRRHLDLVFKHEIDPAMGGKTHQDTLNALHSPGIDPGNLIARC